MNRFTDFMWLPDWALVLFAALPLFAPLWCILDVGAQDDARQQARDKAADRGGA